jgi:outer membrane protein assembly factor BamB
MKRFSHPFRPFIFLLPFLLSCAAQSSYPEGFDWPAWRGPDGNGQSRETNWDPRAIASHRVAWSTNIGIGYSNVAIQGGRLYATGVNEERRQFILFCLDAATGKQIWQHVFARPSLVQSVQSTPTVDGDLVFVLDFEGFLYCLDARTGKQQWQKNLVTDFGALKPYYGFAGPPVVAGDLLILTANTAGMALKRDSGKLMWTSEKPPKDAAGAGETSTATSYSAPVLYSEGDRCIAILARWHGITAVDVRTGKPAWQFDWKAASEDLITDPVVIGDKVCVAQATDLLLNPAGFLLQIKDGTPLLLWESPSLWAKGAAPIIIDRCIYSLFGTGFSQSGKGPTALRCLDLETGRLVWEERFGGPLRAKKHFSLTAANGTLIILDDLGTLYTAEASPAGYREIARCDVLQGMDVMIRLFWTPPVLCNARIYCRNYAGELVCIDVRK